MKSLGLITVLSAALLAAPLACAQQADAPAAAPASQAGVRHAKKHSMDWTKPAAEAAPGGGPGKVWVNAGSKVYHCVGDKWYGRTKHGKYLDEDAAKAKGFHGPHGKGCTS
ncbi:hypothetical protein QMK61_06755 [Fulvimonas sp. R45]|uniref:hypothetical protein n=1 Tax=Fulvimonas sp. R45 TaxID=3045937 RepID=UPI00265DD745|nr:hypothetical protein [Fulvimonas sp. R45]MDO1528534.1 hypothetical protein [Fulvimonas sp. R45]